MLGTHRKILEGHQQHIAGRVSLVAGVDDLLTIGVL